jgi:regulator of replication initiation timing
MNDLETRVEELMEENERLKVEEDTFKMYARKMARDLYDLIRGKGNDELETELIELMNMF